MPFLQLFYTAASGEFNLGSHFVDIYISFLVCLASFAAFYMGRLLGLWWAASQKPREENANMCGILLLFQRLPHLPSVLKQFDERIPQILGTNAQLVPCCCDVSARVFVDLALPEWENLNSSMQSPEVQTDYNEDGRNTNTGSSNASVSLPSLVKSDDVQKTKKSIRLPSFMRRSKYKVSTSTAPDVGQSNSSPVAPEPKVNAQCENGLSRTDDGSYVQSKNVSGNRATEESAAPPSWERLVEQKVMRILSGPSTMRNCHLWDVHCIKSPDIFFQRGEDEEKERDDSLGTCGTLCGGILLRMRLPSASPTSALQLALEGGLVTSSADIKMSGAAFRPWAFLLHALRDLARVFPSPPAPAPFPPPARGGAGTTAAAAPSKNFVLLRPHAAAAPRRIAAALSAWARGAAVAVADVESVLLADAARRLAAPAAFAAASAAARILRESEMRESGESEMRESGADIGAAALGGRRARAVYCVADPNAARPFAAVQCGEVVCPAMWLPKAICGGDIEAQTREAERMLAEAMRELEEAVMGARQGDGATEVSSSL